MTPPCHCHWQRTRKSYQHVEKLHDLLWHHQGPSFNHGLLSAGRLEALPPGPDPGAHVCTQSTYVTGVKGWPLSPYDQYSNIKVSWKPAVVLPHRIVTLFSSSECPASALSQVCGDHLWMRTRGNKVPPIITQKSVVPSLYNSKFFKPLLLWFEQFILAFNPST